MAEAQAMYRSVNHWTMAALIAALYFVPAITARLRKHHNALAIFWTNLLLGWTVIGWVVALIWSCTNQPRRSETQS